MLLLMLDLSPADKLAKGLLLLGGGYDTAGYTVFTAPWTYTNAIVPLETTGTSLTDLRHGSPAATSSVHHTTVNHYTRACNEVRRRTRQKQDCASEVPGIAPSASRSPIRNVPFDLRIGIYEALCEGCFDIPWTDAIHLDGLSERIEASQ